MHLIFLQKTKIGSNIYNIGGGRKNSCSILEAIEIIEKLSNKKSKFKIINKNRIGDHIWWISDNSKFISDFPKWSVKKDLKSILIDIISKKNINA